MLQFSLIVPEAPIRKGSNEVEKGEAKANALALWLLSYHFPPKIRKCADQAHIVARSSKRGWIELECAGGDSPADSALGVLGWECKARSALRKIYVEDLGNMDATLLFQTIPETDSEGRGVADMRSMEKKLSVKVVFDEVTGHVYLVGDAKKIEKKCFALRNMLSHYHWRLSGKDVALG